MSLRKMKNEGFTLVELMVVVAIIGILSAIAIPNFKKYQAKSKTTEAKLQLAALYTAEISFSTDFDVFATCLTSMGFDPTPNQSTRYYAIGFGAEVGAANQSAVDNGAPAECVDTTGEGQSFFPAGKKVGGKSAGVEHLAIDGDVINSTYDEFKATAAGIIDPGKADAATCDKWAIDHNKKLQIVKVGY